MKQLFPIKEKDKNQLVKKEDKKLPIQIKPEDAKKIIKVVDNKIEKEMAGPNRLKFILIVCGIVGAVALFIALQNPSNFDEVAYTPPTINHNDNYDKQDQIPGTTTNDDGGSKNEENPNVEGVTYNINDKKISKVHFLNVGNADSTFIEIDGKTILIDSGNRGDGKGIVEFIKKRGYNSIDILIGTHPHEDHIGGMQEVLNGISVKSVYMPRISDKLTPSTKVYEYTLSTIIDKGLQIISPKNGEVLLQGDNYSLVVVNDTSLATNLNDYSIATLFTHDNVKYLFTGDLEQEGEKNLLKFSSNLDADIMKSGHHGSKTSNSEDLLKVVTPDIAIIPTGSDNDYGHPHKEVLKRYSKFKIKSYRNDQNGTVTLLSDGKLYKDVLDVTKLGEIGREWDGVIHLPEEFKLQ